MTEACGQRQVVERNEDGAAFVCEALKVLEKGEGMGGVEASGRFIGDENAGALRQRAGDEDAGPLATG